MSEMKELVEIVGELIEVTAMLNERLTLIEQSMGLMIRADKATNEALQQMNSGIKQQTEALLTFMEAYK